MGGYDCGINVEVDEEMGSTRARKRGPGELGQVADDEGSLLY